MSQPVFKMLNIFKFVILLWIGLKVGPDTAIMVYFLIALVGWFLALMVGDQ